MFMTTDKKVARDYYDQNEFEDYCPSKYERIGKYLLAVPEGTQIEEGLLNENCLAMSCYTDNFYTPLDLQEIELTNQLSNPPSN